MAVDRTATLRHAENLLQQGKLEAAIEEYRLVVDEQPRDWATANVLGDLYVRAGQIDHAVEQFVRVADHLSADGFASKATALYKKVLKLKPEHEYSLLQSAQIAASQGLFADARAHLAAVSAIRRARGDEHGAADAQIRLGTLDPADYAGRIAAANARVGIGDGAGAIRDMLAIAGEFDLRGRHTDALDVLRSAPVAPDHPELAADLARALLAHGDAATAGKHLTLASAGSDPHLRLTVAEILLLDARIDEGVAIAGALIDEDRSLADEVAALASQIEKRAPDASVALVDLVARILRPEPEPEPEPAPESERSAVPQPATVARNAHAINIDDLLNEFESTEAAEVVTAPAPVVAADLDGVFSKLRDEVARQPGIDAGEGEYKRAVMLYNAGDHDGCIEALHAASRSPGVRFTAAAMLARVYRDRGRLADALDWFERATLVPPPAPGDYHALLLDLADALEQAGEPARALAVCLELQTEAGEYRDVTARVARLTIAQAGGTS